MEVSKNKWNEMEKRLADLEGRVQGQQKIILLHIDAHRKENEELNRILSNIKAEVYKAVEQTS